MSRSRSDNSAARSSRPKGVTKSPVSPAQRAGPRHKPHAEQLAEDRSRAGRLRFLDLAYAEALLSRAGKLGGNTSLTLIRTRSGGVAIDGNQPPIKALYFEGGPMWDLRPPRRPRHRPAINIERDKDIRRRFAAGVTQAQIARELGLKPTLVRAVISRSRRKNPSWSLLP
jgi:DNA-binding CsgD family transcriptional regulator